EAPPPPDLLEARRVERQHVLAVEPDRALDPAAARREHAQQRPQGHALARARLSKEAEDLALLERDVDAVEGVDGALAVKAHVQVANFDDRAHGDGIRR